MAVGVMSVGMIFIASLFPVGHQLTNIAAERTIAAVTAESIRRQRSADTSARAASSTPTRRPMADSRRLAVSTPSKRRYSAREVNIR